MREFQKIIALVPIKKESQRLKNKNFLLFDGKPMYHIIINKLEQCPSISKIIINTDSDEIAINCQKLYSKVTVFKRPKEILGNEITMNTIIDTDLTKVKGEHFFQTHVTNPILTIKTIEKSIETYFNNLKTNDSLFSVNTIKKRVYNHNSQPINHQNSKLEQTQNLPEVYIENSNIFIFSRSSFYKNYKSRIGRSPFIFKMSELEGIDIDYKDDFILAELIYNNQRLFNKLG